MAEEEKPKLPVTEWPIKTASVRLAHNLRAPRKEGEDAPFHKPPTENGRVKIGMEAVIFLPSLAVQKIGFTPYKIETRPKEGGGTEEVPVDATRDLMAHYQGIYKRID